MSPLFKCPKWLLRFLGQEDILTINCANYQRTKPVLFHHTFNEGKRSRTMQMKLKGFGVLEGIPDFLIFESRYGFKGLAVEIKVVYANGSKNRLSKSQIKVQEDLIRKGWAVYTVWTFEDFEKVVNEYLRKDK